MDFSGKLAELRRLHCEPMSEVYWARQHLRDLRRKKSVAVVLWPFRTMGKLARDVNVWALQPILEVLRTRAIAMCQKCEADVFVPCGQLLHQTLAALRDRAVRPMWTECRRGCAWLNTAVLQPALRLMQRSAGAASRQLHTVSSWAWRSVLVPCGRLVRAVALPCWRELCSWSSQFASCMSRTLKALVRTTNTASVHLSEWWSTQPLPRRVARGMGGGARTFGVSVRDRFMRPVSDKVRAFSVWVATNMLTPVCSRCKELGRRARLALARQRPAASPVKLARVRRHDERNALV